jgi:sugar phosphate isomerase/epimerase
MKVGSDGKTLVQFGTTIDKINYAHKLKLDGILFRSVLDLSPTLDPGELKEVKAFADDLDIYLELGIGRVNPYNTAEMPKIRSLGEGDYRLGIEKLIRAAKSIDCAELWAVTAGYQDRYRDYYVFDRFRTDVHWEDQLIATQNFLQSLAPMLRDLGCRINIETHEEISTFEVVHLVEKIGPDILGITFDTGNVLIRGEHPIMATRRVAPYVRQTHIKDAILYKENNVFVRQLRPIGEGVIDWVDLLSILSDYSPNLNLSIEDHRGLMKIHAYDSHWRSMHPDLSDDELLETLELTKIYDCKVQNNEIVDHETYNSLPYDQEGKRASILASAKYLKHVLKTKGFE